MNWLHRMLEGRNGFDGLAAGIMVAGMVFSLLNGFTEWLPFLLLSYLCFGLVLFRMFSKNVPARQRENQMAAEFFRPVWKWMQLQKKKWNDRKNYRYFKCPNCKQHVRVPKNHGKVRIVCPRCKKDFIRKT